MTTTVPADLRYVRVGLNSLCQTDADKNATALSGHYGAIVLDDDGHSVDLLVLSEMEPVTLSRPAFDRTAVDLLAGYSPKTRVDTLRRLRERLPLKVETLTRAGADLSTPRHRATLDRAAAVLGAAENAIEEALAAEPAREVIDRREERKLRLYKQAEALSVAKARAARVERRFAARGIRATAVASTARIGGGKGGKAATVDVAGLNGKPLPRQGTDARIALELMLRPEGASMGEIAEALRRPKAKFAVRAAGWAETYGLGLTKTPAEGGTRYALVARTGPAAAA